MRLSAKVFAKSFQSMGVVRSTREGKSHFAFEVSGCLAEFRRLSPAHARGVHLLRFIGGTMLPKHYRNAIPNRAGAELYLWAPDPFVLYCYSAPFIGKIGREAQIPL